MTLNGVMTVTLRYFTEFGKPALQKTICGGIYAKVYCILVRVQCRRKESSRSLSHLLMSFLFSYVRTGIENNGGPANLTYDNQYLTAALFVCCRLSLR